jgi:hypothetical protein
MGKKCVSVFTLVLLLSDEGIQNVDEPALPRAGFETATKA